MSGPIESVRKGPRLFRKIIITLLKLPDSITDEDLDKEVARIKRLYELKTPLEAQVSELEAAAKTCAKNGMYETGDALRNKAAGIRYAIAEIESQNQPS